MEKFNINIDDRVERELQDELNTLGKEVEKDAFFDKKEDGTKAVNMKNVNAFLETIKSQSWSDIIDQKQDRLWVTAVQIKLSSLGYNLGVKGVDGWFWAATKAAVEEFQVTNWLNKDGFPGKDTITKLLDPNVTKASKEVEDSVVEKAKDNKKGNDFEEALKSESLLNTVFMNLSPWDQMQFKSGIKPLKTTEYSYQIVNGVMARTNISKNLLELKKTEYFQKGQRKDKIETEKKKEKTASKPKKHPKIVSIEQDIQQIPTLKNIYSNLSSREQTNFKIGITTISTNEYNYQTKNKVLTRVSKPKNIVELPQTEQFKNGRREKLAKKQEVTSIKTNPFKIEDFFALWKEEVDSYNTLQDWQKKQFSVWLIAIETPKYRYKVISKQLTRETKPSNLIELPQTEILKNWKRERMT